MDSLLSSFIKKPHFLKFPWADITQIRMTPSVVVKHFNVVNEILSGLISSLIVCEK